MSTPVLRVVDLHRSFEGRAAVAGVSLEVEAGERVGLLGPNGAGKTTTISMICGLLTPDSGTVEVSGAPMGPSGTQARRHIGLVPQDIAVYPDLSARENLDFFARIHGLGKAERVDQLAHVLDVVGLAARADDRVDTYSGGMKRRLNIAIGLVNDPSLLILDEPTVGVDPQSRNAILEAIEGLTSEGMAILYTTHYMEEAERLCDRVAIMDLGRILAVGTPDELMQTVGGTERILIRGRLEHPDLKQYLTRLEPVVDVVLIDDGSAIVEVASAREATAPLLVALADAGVEISSVEVQRANLEAVFLSLTGKALRD